MPQRVWRSRANSGALAPALQALPEDGRRVWLACLVQEDVSPPGVLANLALDDLKCLRDKRNRTFHGLAGPLGRLVPVDVEVLPARSVVLHVTALQLAHLLRPEKGYLQERFEAVREMPRKDQQFVVKFLDQVLEDYQRRRRK